MNPRNAEIDYADVLNDVLMAVVWFGIGALIIVGAAFLTADDEVIPKAAPSVVLCTVTESDAGIATTCERSAR
jgi:hypothetical protein